MHRSIGTVRGIRGEEKERLQWEGFAEKESFKPEMKEWRSDGWWVVSRWNWWRKCHSKEPDELELERLVRGWRREARSWFQRWGEAYWKERSVDMMWMDEQVWPKMKSECCEEAELWWGYADMKAGWLWELCRWQELVFYALSYL